MQKPLVELSVGTVYRGECRPIPWARYSADASRKEAPLGGVDLSEFDNSGSAYLGDELQSDIIPKDSQHPNTYLGMQHRNTCFVYYCTETEYHNNAGPIRDELYTEYHPECPLIQLETLRFWLRKLDRYCRLSHNKNKINFITCLVRMACNTLFLRRQW